MRTVRREPRLEPPARTLEWCLAIALLAVFCTYLTRFVTVGWIPHDEGTLGQAADRILSGQIPHVDFEEPYTGGLSRFYASLFAWYGIELVNLRWSIFWADVASLGCIFLIVSRFVRPFPAAIAACVAGLWSFPNYVAPLPSWWLLLSALLAMTALLSYQESGSAKPLAVVGLAVGGALAAKQTGAYVAMAIAWALLFQDSPPQPAPGRAWRLVLRVGLVLSGVVFAAAVMGSKLWDGNGAYFFLPLLACALLLLRPNQPSVVQDVMPFALRDLAVVAVFAAIPLAWLVWPYAIRQQLGIFLYGLLVLPTVRLAVAVRNAPPAEFLFMGVPFLLLLTMNPPPKPVHRRLFIAVAWTVAVTLPVASRWSFFVYQTLFQGARAVVALLPVVICYYLWRGTVAGARARRSLFLCAVFLAWLSLNQYPFAAPIYFGFIAPLGVIAALALAHETGRLTFHRLGPIGALFGLFALLSLNPSHERSYGKAYDPVEFSTPLELPRAHLVLTAADASDYRRVVTLIEQHLGDGSLVAGPDAPELYYLLGRFSPTNVFFDVLDPGAAYQQEALWDAATVIAVNNRPGFSPPLTAPLRSKLAGQFPQSETIGRYEVRWR